MIDIPKIALKFGGQVPLGSIEAHCKSSPMSIKVESNAPSPALTRTDAVSLARAGGDRSAAIAATASTDTLVMTNEATVLKAMENGLARDHGAFNAAKVEALRSAIADGSYQVNPDRIAGRIVEIELELFA